MMSTMSLPVTSPKLLYDNTQQNGLCQLKIMRVALTLSHSLVKTEALHNMHNTTVIHGWNILETNPTSMLPKNLSL